MNGTFKRNNRGTFHETTTHKGMGQIKRNEKYGKALQG